MRTLSLAHLTLMSADPIQLIEAAEAAEFTHIGMRIVPPTPDAPMRTVIGDAPFQRTILRRLSASGVKVLDVEAFWLTAETDVNSIEPAFAFGADLGATYVVVVGNDPQSSRLIDNFTQLTEVAQRYRLQTSLEFIPYSQVRTLADAHNIVRSCGYPNAGLLVDVLHLSRSGATPADLAQLPAGAVHYLHLCDAPRLAPTDLAAIKVEARSGRLYPGEGDLLLREFVAAADGRVPVAIEAPDGRRAHLSYFEQARLARSATIRLLELEGSQTEAER